MFIPLQASYYLPPSGIDKAPTLRRAMGHQTCRMLKFLVCFFFGLDSILPTEFSILYRCCEILD